MLAAEDLGDPTLVLDLDRVTQTLEAFEDAGVVARLANNVEVLGCARDAGVHAERIGAGQEERNAEFRQLAETIRIERARHHRGRPRPGCGVEAADIAASSSLSR